MVQNILNSSSENITCIAENIPYISKYCLLWAGFGHAPAKQNSVTIFRTMEFAF